MPRRPPPKELAPILYFRSPDSPKPDTQAVLRAAMAGHPIELRQERDFLSLFHAMDRLGVFGDYRLLRKKTGPDRWLAYVVPLRDYRLIEGGAATVP